MKSSLRVKNVYKISVTSDKWTTWNIIIGGEASKAQQKLQITTNMLEIHGSESVRGTGVQRLFCDKSEF